MWKNDRPLSSSHSPHVPNSDSDATHSTQLIIVIFREAEHWRNTSSLLMAWEKAGRCQAPVKQNMDFSLQTICMTYNGVGGPDKEGPIPGSSKHGQWCSTCLLWVTVIEIHLRTSIAVSASQASWQVADLQSCSMMHIRGEGRGMWGDTKEICGFVSTSGWESWLS